METPIPERKHANRHQQSSKPKARCHFAESLKCRDLLTPELQEPGVRESLLRGWAGGGGDSGGVLPARFQHACSTAAFPQKSSRTRDSPTRTSPSPADRPHPPQPPPAVWEVTRWEAIVGPVHSPPPSDCPPRSTCRQGHEQGRRGLGLVPRGEETTTSSPPRASPHSALSPRDQPHPVPSLYPCPRLQTPFLCLCAPTGGRPRWSLKALKAGVPPRPPAARPRPQATPPHPQLARSRRAEMHAGPFPGPPLGSPGTHPPGPGCPSLANPIPPTPPLPRMGTSRR